jgi:hypothetical protein
VSEQRSNGRLNGNRRRLLQGVDSRRSPDRDLPLAARLRALAEHHPPTSIDELWVFPPLQNRGAAGEFILVTSFEVLGAGRRRVVTAHVEPEFKDEDGVEFVWVQRIVEVGAVRQEWLEALPDSLLGRFAEAGVPEVLEIGGRAEAWEEALTRFANENGNGHQNGSAPPSGNGAAADSGHAAVRVDSPATP